MRCCLSAASSSGLPRWAGACADSVHAEMPINTLLSLQEAVSSMPVSGTVMSFLDDNMSDILFKVRDLVVNLGIAWYWTLVCTARHGVQQRACPDMVKGEQPSHSTLQRVKIGA